MNRTNMGFFSFALILRQVEQFFVEFLITRFYLKNMIKRYDF